MVNHHSGDIVQSLSVKSGRFFFAMWKHHGFTHERLINFELKHLIFRVIFSGPTMTEDSETARGRKIY